jgi:hypothetical protein
MAMVLLGSRSGDVRCTRDDDIGLLVRTGRRICGGKGAFKVTHNSMPTQFSKANRQNVAPLAWWRAVEANPPELDNARFVTSVRASLAMPACSVSTERLLSDVDNVEGAMRRNQSSAMLDCWISSCAAGCARSCAHTTAMLLAWQTQPKCSRSW